MPENEEEKRPVGRPVVEPAERKKISATMYLNREEHEYFMSIVKESGMSLSNFIRDKCKAFLKEGGTNGKAEAQ